MAKRIVSGARVAGRPQKAQDRRTNGTATSALDFYREERKHERRIAARVRALLRACDEKAAWNERAGVGAQPAMPGAWLAAIVASPGCWLGSAFVETVGAARDLWKSCLEAETATADRDLDWAARVTGEMVKAPPAASVPGIAGLLAESTLAVEIPCEELASIASAAEMAKVLGREMLTPAAVKKARQRDRRKGRSPA